jgi:hypothetical protein
MLQERLEIVVKTQKRRANNHEKKAERNLNGSNNYNG